MIFKDMFYGNKVRLKNINDCKKLLLSLIIFNLHKIKTIIKSLFFR